MSRFFRYLCCLILFASAVHAQQYPVTASTQIIPPYSVYLPDYVVPGSEKLRVILVQNDLTTPSYDVRLQMTIEQNGTLIMRTAAPFKPRPITLSPGVPTIISGAALYDYLNLDNIEFSGGFNRDVYERTKALPEGAYRITFTAYDYHRPTVQISNSGANVFFFRKNDPPLLNLPVCGSRVEKLTPQFITFNWSSRNSASPVDGSETEYVFSLYEIKPAGTNADFITRSTRPLFTTVTSNTSIAYGPGEPPLTDSMSYVWNIQARDKSGRDAFNNQGFSQNCTFTYLGTNPFVVNNISKPVLKGKSTGERNIRLSWVLADPAYHAEAYRVQYRAAAQNGTEFDWQSYEAPEDTLLDVNSLEPGRTYEAKLQWKIAGVYGPFSDVIKIKTDSPRVFTCGDAANVTPSANTKPLQTASAGMIFRVGNFDVLLTSITGGTGTFSGKGRIITPGFGMGLPVQFSNITVNTDLVVTKGEMQAVTSGIDKFVSDAVKEQRGGNDVGHVKSGDVPPDIVTKLYLFGKDNIRVDTSAGTITLTDSKSGQQEVINYKDKQLSLPLVIEDADGNLYKVDKSGNVTTAGKRDSSLANNPTALQALNKLDFSTGKVIFSAGPDNKYSFDSWKDEYAGKPVLDSSYELISGYRVSAKAIVPNAQETITATLSGSIDTVRFVNGKGIVYPAIHNGNVYTVTITGGPAGDAQELYAVYADTSGKNHSIGKLLIASYAPAQRTVVIIPVGHNTTLSEATLRNTLNNTYGSIGTTWNVITDESFRDNTAWDLNLDGNLQDAGSALLSNGFSGEEKQLCKVYRKSHEIDDKAVYLFLVNEVALQDADLLGKMPRQSQYGILFTKNQSPESIARAAAHEIGHGAFTLEHTFSAGIGLTKGSTGNLMDYGDGFALLKYQWDIVYDPGHVWGLLEDDGEQESVGYADIKVFEPLNNKPSGTYTFITPGGSYITLPATARNLRFATLDRTFYLLHGVVTAQSKPAENLVSLGALTSFTLDNARYSARFINGNFNSYATSGNKDYEDKYTLSLQPSSAIAALLGVKDGTFVTYASRFSNGFATTQLKAPYYGSSVLYNQFSVVNLDLSDNAPLAEQLEDRRVEGPLLTLPVTDLYFVNEDVALNIGGNAKASIKDFLLQVLSKDSPIKDYLTFYTLANLKDEDLNSYKSCLEPSTWSSTIRTRLKELIFNETVGHSVSPDDFYSQMKDRVLQELKAMSMDGDQLLKDLHAAVLAKKPQDSIHTILAANYAYCAFPQLPLADRMYILKQLLSGDINNDNWYTHPKLLSGNDGPFIVGDLIKTTPEEDRLSMLKDGFMADNFQWLRNLMNQSTLWLNGVGYDDVHDVADAIVPWITQYFGELNIKPATALFQDQMYGAPPVTYYPGQDEFMLGVKSNTDYRLGGGLQQDGVEIRMGPYMYADIDYNDNGKIHMREYYGRAVIPLAFTPAGVSVETPTYVIHYDQEYNPFEPVTLTSVKPMPELGFDAGTQVMVPAYMAWFYYRDFNRVQAARNVRTAVNILNISAAVFLAPESGGGTLALLSQLTTNVCAVVSTVDVVVQSEKTRLSSDEYKDKKSFYDAWDKVVSVTNDANLVAGGLHLGVVKFRQLSTTLSEVRTVLDGAPATYANLRSAWAQVKAARLLAAEAAAATAAANKTAMQIAQDALDIQKSSILIAGEDLSHVIDWIKKGDPNTVYIIVHGEGDAFKVIRNGVDQTLTTESLGDWILSQKISATSDIVLLSCADIETAKKLSAYINRNLIANHGWVDLAENGAIAGEHPFVEITPSGTTTELAASKVSATALEGATVRLGGTTSSSGRFSTQITDETVKHVIHGEVRVTVRPPVGSGNTPIWSKTYRADRVWSEIKEDVILGAGWQGLAVGARVEVRFAGIHCMKTLIENPTAFRFVTYVPPPGSTVSPVVGQIAGVNVDVVVPEVFIPDVETIINTGRWTELNGRWIAKGSPGGSPGIATQFPSNITENEILDAMTDAVNNIGSAPGAVHEPIVIVRGANVKMRVVLNVDRSIKTAFILSVTP